MGSIRSKPRIIEVAGRRLKRREIKGVVRFVKHIPRRLKAAYDFAALMAQLKPRSFKTKSN
jgi:hypothetical protein